MDARTPIDLDLESDPIVVDVDDGAVVVTIGEQSEKDEPASPFNFDANLALQLDDPELSRISSQILDGIDRDEQSRRDALEIRSRGIDWLALKIEDPRTETTSASAPLEGQSRVRHPLLLEAVVAFQAGARAELLPAAGPVKVRDDVPPGAPAAMPGQLPLSQGTASRDQLAQALEIQLNRYLTAVATEYVPDTDRMLFSVGFGGDGFKKGYHCPLRNRPVIESISMEDLIVSNAAVDLQNCGRVTHQAKMRRSIMRRMQILGEYRDVNLQRPAPNNANEVEIKKSQIEGYQVNPIDPEDTDYTIFECYAELDLDQFAPEHLKGKALPLPYRITIEKDSRQVLDIRRDWREHDEMCLRKRTFIQFPFIRGLGFYGYGFLHLLGNTVVALTAAWRAMLDSGMFANFPGGLINKIAARQLTNQLRCPPGGFIPLEVPAGQDIRTQAMPLPYKETGPAFPAFINQVEQNAKQVAMTANPQVGEGDQNAPVGTTLALIEQATKVVASAFKRLHAAQCEEFAMLRELLLEDPEALWRHSYQQPPDWQKQQFVEALQRTTLVPVADPNNPTQLHRLAKSAILKTLQAANPAIYDPIAIDRRVMDMAGIDPEGLFRPPQPQADPMQAIMQARLQQQQLALQIKAQQNSLQAAQAAMEQQGRAADRASRERVEMMKAQIAQMRDQEQAIIQQMKLVLNEIIHIRGMIGAEHTQQQNGLDHRT